MLYYMLQILVKLYIYVNYTVRQKKETNFLLCAYLLILDKNCEFFSYILSLKDRISYNSVYLILACVKNFA